VTIRIVDKNRFAATGASDMAVVGALSAFDNGEIDTWSLIVPTYKATLWDNSTNKAIKFEVIGSPRSIYFYKDGRCLLAVPLLQTPIALEFNFVGVKGSMEKIKIVGPQKADK
jgi:hypothetical protein